MSMSNVIPPLTPNRAALCTFFEVLLKRADPEGFVHFLMIEHASGRVLHRQALPVTSVQKTLTDRVLQLVAEAARHDQPAVFMATTSTLKTAFGAATDNIANGLCIVAELDERPIEARAKLTAVLGEPTLAVASGGRWKNPSTGAFEDKQHLYWRLTKPTGTEEEHRQLRMCRALVCEMVRSDRSAISLVHPMRCAGSWHTKGEPRLAEIIWQSEKEVDLDEALSKLRAACPGYDAEADHVSAEKARGEPEDLASAIEVIPNDATIDWDKWNMIGMALFRATGGSEEGLELFLKLSAKNVEKFDEKRTRRRWEEITRSPPEHLTAGTIYHLAKMFDPDWISPSRQRARGKQVEACDALARLNRDFAVVMDGGKTRVLRFEEEQLNGHKRQVITYLPVEDFRNFHMNRFVQEGDKAVPLGTWWLRHPERSTYHGLVFEPGSPREIDGKRNLWCGWGVEPKPGTWDLMKVLIREVLADGNPEHELYITRWIAWAVQNPAQRAEVALVLKGKRGTGKSTFGNTLVTIFGPHGKHISSADHLAGRFNAHLRDTCLLFGDEAFWPGDKSAEGTLKRMITEPDLFIEAKGRDGVVTPNRLHVILASNDEWVIPAGEDERRYAVFNVSSRHMQDATKFGPLHTEMKNGGLASMLHDLLHLDLEDFHPRQVPKTQGLLDQQKRSLSPEGMWWCELLETGELAGADPKRPNCAVSNSWEDEREVFSGNTLRGRRKGLFDQARDISPKLKGWSDHLLGRYLTNRGCSNDKKVLRHAGWTFPPLAQLRKEWEANYKGWKWRDPTVIEWHYVDPDNLERDPET